MQEVAALGNDLNLGIRPGLTQTLHRQASRTTCQCPYRAAEFRQGGSDRPLHAATDGCALLNSQSVIP